MICAAEDDLGRNSNAQQKKETLKEQMDRQDFHTHCSYVRAWRSPYLRQHTFAGGEHILPIPWCLCQGATFPGQSPEVPGGCQLHACQELSYQQAWDVHTQTHRAAPLSRACFLPLPGLWAHAVLLQGCRALLRDMGRLSLPALEFQVEILLFEWKKKVLQTLVPLPALSL